MQKVLAKIVEVTYLEFPTYNTARICRGGRTHGGGEGFISMLSSFRQPSHDNRLQQCGSIHARPIQTRLAPLQGVHCRIWRGPLPSTALSGMVHTRTGKPWPPIPSRGHVGLHLLDASSSRPRHEEKSTTSHCRQICVPCSTLPLTQWRLYYFPAPPDPERPLVRFDSPAQVDSLHT